MINKWSSNNSNICIYHVCGGCPYEILKNTKLSIGTCKYKDHNLENENNSTIDKIFYEQELLKILSEFFLDLEKKQNWKEEIKLDQKISYIENSITTDNISDMYDKFLELETEIYDLEKIKENFYVKNKNIPMEKCEVCGMSIITNFCSKKYISHVNGRAHIGVLKLRRLYNNLLNER